MNAADSLSGVVQADAVGEVGADLLWDRPGAAPEAVVRPSSTSEVAAVLEWASEKGIGVLPICSGTRAPTVPSGRYVALSTERLSGIEIYEPADLTLTAGAGSAVSDIEEALRPNGQWMPFDPPHVVRRSLGGLVALGESGPLWAGYGSLRNHVLGMTIVTGDGRELRLGGRVVKNVAGFDLLKPMVGSRGRLGIVTSVCLRVFPLPEVEGVFVVTGEDLATLAMLALRVGTAPVLPVSCVLVDDIGESRGAGLVIRLHGAAPTVDSDRGTLEKHLERVLEPVSAEGDLVARVRDHGAEAAIWIEATVLPSRLSEALASIHRLGPAATAVDTYAARIRAGVEAVDQEVLSNVRASIERLGGTLRVTKEPDQEVATSAESEPRAETEDLTARIVEAFDPEAVLWPARVGS
jgi:glycolate oxidase FAD binding subunit